MINGIYYNPTMVFFGEGMESGVGGEVAKYSRNILLHFGGDSFKKFGLYDKVTASLRETGVRFVELGGVKPNPRAELVYEGIDLCRKNNIDFVLAVGGGSVIDSAKAIGIGAPWGGDFFDFYEGKQIPHETLKVGTILTIPGSGAESNAGSVITHEGKTLKLACSYPLMMPVFSIMNPRVTFTLTHYQTTCGIVDAIAHVFERYFSNTPYVECTDRIGEGMIKTLMKYAVLVKKEPVNYGVRAEIMWACKLAHDDTAGFGRKQDWSSHAISHELGAIYDVPHGAALGVIFPAWMRYVYRTNMDRFTRFAVEVFGIDAGDRDEGKADRAILSAIDKLKSFLGSIEMPVTLRDLGVRDKTRFTEISQKCVRGMKSGTIGNFIRLSPQDVSQILEIAY
jgi:alcohol dehydrogenase